MGRVLRWGLRIAGFACALAILGGYLGALHPIGDSLAVFRLWLALVLAFIAIGLVLLGARRFGGAAFALAVVGAAPIALAGVVPTGLSAQDGRDTRLLYQKNLLFRLSDAEPLLEDVRLTSPDFITLQEVSTSNRRQVYDALSAIYNRHICPFTGVGAVAVAARFEPVEGSRICREGSGLAAMQVVTPDGPVWVVSIHLHWPWPFGQAAQVEALLPILDNLEGPVVIGGDFNMVPWSHAVRRIRAAADVEGGAPIRGTLRERFPLMPLPIDHVFTPSAPILTYRPRLGSDHNGVLARFDLAAH